MQNTQVETFLPAQRSTACRKRHLTLPPQQSHAHGYGHTSTGNLWWETNGFLHAVQEL